MIPFRFRIKLLDPLFYSREGLAASHTPHMLHATAINGAVCAALGVKAEHHPFMMSDENGGMDTPRYTSSLLTESFYFTPASPHGELGNWVEIVKGDNEGYKFETVAGEILKATQLHFIAPESEFQGLGLVFEKVQFPGKIRLGSFRGMASLKVEVANQYQFLSNERIHGVTHAVDPLVSIVKRGVLNNMFPYPVVCNAACESVCELYFDKPTLGSKVERLAWPTQFKTPTKPKRMSSSANAII